MRPLLTVATGVLLVGVATAQVSVKDLEFLLGKKADLTKITKGLDPGKVESLTKHTPDWMRTLIRRTWEKKTTAGLLKQLSRLLGDGGLAQGITEVLARRAASRIVALEGEWLGKKEDELSLKDLRSLATVYSLLNAPGRYLGILTSTTPWEPILALLLSREYRLSNDQYKQIFDYLKKLPTRARQLHSRAASIILRRSDDPELISRTLRQLSHIYGANGKPQAAVLLLREAMRRKAKIDGRDWILLGQHYAQALDTKRARRALKVARSALAADDVTAAIRENSEQRIAKVEELVKVAEDLAAVARHPAKSHSTEDKIRTLSMLRTLSRPIEAGKLAQELDDVPIHDSRVYSNLGLLCIHGGLRDKAVKCLQIAAKLPNQDSTFRQLRAWLLVRPMLEECILLFRGEGDPERAMKRVAALRADVGVLVSKHDLHALAIPKLVLDLATEFEPAIREKDMSLGIEILTRNKARMLELRGTNFGILDLRQVALSAIAAIQDAETFRRVLENPTAAERTDFGLAKLMCVLAYELRLQKRDDATRKLVRATMSELPEASWERHVFLGVEAAMTADETGGAKSWELAIGHFRSGLKIEKLNAGRKACLLNNAAICLYYLGRKQEALSEFADAIAADPKGQNTARLNAITCTPSPDAAALSSLSTASGNAQWTNLRDEVRRWQIRQAQTKGDLRTARSLAKTIVANRSPIFGFGHPMILQIGTITWSAGVSSKGADLRVALEVMPWLVRRSPVTRAATDALAK